MALSYAILVRCAENMSTTNIPTAAPSEPDTTAIKKASKSLKTVVLCFMGLFVVLSLLLSAMNTGLLGYEYVVFRSGWVNTTAPTEGTGFNPRDEVTTTGALLLFVGSTLLMLPAFISVVCLCINKPKSMVVDWFMHLASLAALGVHAYFVTKVSLWVACLGNFLSGVSFTDLFYPISLAVDIVTIVLEVLVLVLGIIVYQVDRLTLGLRVGLGKFNMPLIGAL